MCAVNSKLDRYRCGELWSRYGRTGTAELHSTPQIKITDLYWGHLSRKMEENIILLFSIPLGTTNVLLNASCLLKATYPISVFTKDVLQLKVSVGNACIKGHCGFILISSWLELFFLWALAAVWILTYLLCAGSQELGQCP